MARQTPAAVREDTNESLPEKINSNLVQNNQVIFIIHKFYLKKF